VTTILNLHNSQEQPDKYALLLEVVQKTMRGFHISKVFVLQAEYAYVIMIQEFILYRITDPQFTTLTLKDIVNLHHLFI